MNKIALILVGLLGVIGLLIYAPPAAAHVLITDTTKEIGAILHIQPDDDPIAGEPSHIYYDVQDQQLTNDASAITLTVQSDSDTTDIPFTLNNNGINADYTFPTTGVYSLILSIDSSTATYIFEHTQRVSRGAAASPLNAPTYAWAEILLTTTIVGIAGVCIAVINKRNDIKAYSTF